MKKNDAFGGGLITQADIAQPVVVVIEAVVMESVGGGAGERTTKPVMSFVGCEKRWAFGVESWDLIAKFLGDDSDNWIGHEIELFIDPEVRFKGQRIGGVRPRKPHINDATPPAPPPAPVPKKEPGKQPDKRKGF